MHPCLSKALTHTNPQNAYNKMHANESKKESLKNPLCTRYIKTFANPLYFLTHTQTDILVPYAVV